jgi:hypothetical protein
MCSSCYTTEFFLGFAAGIFVFQYATIFISFFISDHGKEGKDIRQVFCMLKRLPTGLLE